MCSLHLIKPVFTKAEYFFYIKINVFLHLIIKTKKHIKTIE